MGDRYLRRLLVVGMTSLVRRARTKPGSVDPRITAIPDLEAPAPEPLSEIELGTITCPVLIVCGDQTHAQYRLMAESTLVGLPNCSILRFQNTGHGGPVQVPNLFGEVVLDFVSGLAA
jgi:pimeloyl-ACP methyl ester carboxylesterase